MDMTTTFNYGVLILTLVLLEGLLSADNALVLAVLAKRLPKHQQQLALLLGIWGAFVFRMIGILLATWLMARWEFAALGAAYLIYLCVRHFIDRARGQDHTKSDHSTSGHADHPPAQAAGAGLAPIAVAAPAAIGAAAPPAHVPHATIFDAALWRDRQFWLAVAAIEFTDIAFSVDSILAAVGLVNKSQVHPDHRIWLVYLGGILGIIFMRFVATIFLRLLEIFPLLGHAAYFLVGWIGLNLGLEAFARAMQWLDDHGESIHLMPQWVFWSVAAVVFVAALLVRRPAAGGPAQP